MHANLAITLGLKALTSAKQIEFSVFLILHINTHIHSQTNTQYIEYGTVGFIILVRSSVYCTLNNGSELWNGLYFSLDKASLFEES